MLLLQKFSGFMWFICTFSCSYCKVKYFLLKSASFMLQKISVLLQIFCNFNTEMLCFLYHKRRYSLCKKSIFYCKSFRTTREPMTGDSDEELAVGEEKPGSYLVFLTNIPSYSFTSHIWYLVINRPKALSRNKTDFFSVTFNLFFRLFD